MDFSTRSEKGVTMSVTLKAALKMVYTPAEGFSEKDFIENGYHLNTRNYAYEIEKIIGEKLEHQRMISPHGRQYTRYKARNSGQIRKIADFYNGVLKSRGHWTAYKDFQFITEENIKSSMAYFDKQQG